MGFIWFWQNLTYLAKSDFDILHQKLLGKKEINNTLDPQIRAEMANFYGRIN
jgi:hypothetical protein